ncbi:hypothetical protein [Alteromonas oceanisediminis]|uniref:hypothetical protein n=1 Tax=Alteromonas oceanisediminis TaxID=2836180 RepID=UPI001BDA514B|nr:hypothetical protein [Alteromonas oceanisediminis]MBT0585349.1 hypothetical protein [Alteromonas oceanisediminis]
MKRLAQILVGIVLVVIFLVMMGWFVLTDSKPSVSASTISGLNEAESVTSLLGQLQTSIHDRHNAHTITVTKPQIDSLLAFAERAKPEFRGNAELQQYSATLQLSYQLPRHLMERYVNVRVTVLPGNRVHIDQLVVGDLTVRGDWALDGIIMLVDWWTNSDIASFAYEQVTQVAMTTDELSISLQPLNALMDQLNMIKNGLSVEQDDWLSQRTAEYLRYLAIISVDDKSIYHNTQPSLGIYLSAVMRRAQSTGTRTAVEENEAALLALTIFAGHHRFANLVGAVQPDPDRAIRPPHPTVLADRKDLSQHFIISAGLKLLSEQGLTNAIGEFKELMDRVLGGSGYSFVDLAADLAGVKLAKMAIDPRYAADIQQRLAENADESLFFPRIDGLSEGYSKAEFVERFTNVNSAAYLAEVERVQARVDAVPLYDDLRAQ